MTNCCLSVHYYSSKYGAATKPPLRKSHIFILIGLDLSLNYIFNFQVFKYIKHTIFLYFPLSSLTFINQVNFFYPTSPIICSQYVYC
jgi:hypothetical protein